MPEITPNTTSTPNISHQLTDHVQHELLRAAHEAGRAIMRIYDGDRMNIRLKADQSPVTAADHAAEEIILAALNTVMPATPVIAEEATARQGEVTDIGSHKQYFLVDPLDGTKEFISRNGEFTVNIGLVHNDQPVFGIVYAPTKNLAYMTLTAGQAVRFALDVNQPFALPDFAACPTLRVRTAPASGLTVVASRSHMNDVTRAFLERFDIAELISAGSSLKFCKVAEGAADFYCRLGPTMEWDTAAGHAILRAAGGRVTLADGTTPLLYAKTDVGHKNPGFVAWGDERLI